MITNNIVPPTAPPIAATLSDESDCPVDEVTTVQTWTEHNNHYKKHACDHTVITTNHLCRDVYALCTYFKELEYSYAYISGYSYICRIAK